MKTITSKNQQAKERTGETKKKVKNKKIKQYKTTSQKRNIKEHTQ